jgi:4-alpha-glucanotransferase
VTAGSRPANPTRWGVQKEYVDATGARRTVPSGALAGVLESLRADGPGPPARGPVVVHVGETWPRGGRRAELEDGTELAASSGRRLPAGYHALEKRDGSRVPLIVSPRRCHLPAGLRAWGWAAQLYATRSHGSWGIGDLADLRALGRWARRQGAGMLLVNPLHAVRPILPQEPSPYFPSSRLYRNPLYLRIEEMRGTIPEALVRRLARRGQSLNVAPVIDRDPIYALKLEALEAMWDRFQGDPDFDAYCAVEGETLEQYAIFCVLAEHHAGPWWEWPVQYRSPGSSAVRDVGVVERRRVDFHRWLQWQLDEQLARSSREIPIVHDLAIGVAPDGADAWMWQDMLAFGARIGAPPDEFSPAGQDWGLAPFDPHRLRAAGYRPFIQTLRRAMRGAGGVRIDHVMGLFRLWWIPRGARDAAEGAYVRYPAADLLDIVALESHRARAFVVGEDLGTVEAGVRPELRRRGVLSYRLAWFEATPPQRYPAQALAALATHDLPTLAGVWTRADVLEMEQSGRSVNRGAEELVRQRLQRLTGAADDAPVSDVVVRAYRALAGAPSRLVAATLDDATAALRRPNLPGALGRPNWSIPLPRTLEQLRRDQLPRRIAAALAEHQ